jgi:hypothetical protein
MTTPAFTTEDAVRTIIDLNAAPSSRYNSDTIASNIRASAWFLERVTNRIFRNETALTLTFTTNGEASIPIPGLRTASSVTLQSAALTDGASYWLIPDLQQTGVSTAIQFRPFGQGHGDSYLGNPEWFDRNLDSPKWGGGWRNASLPNDLVIAGAWGYTDATLPEPVRDANTRDAAWLTLRSDALLSGARATDQGIFDLSSRPVEVQAFVHEWRTGKQAVAT